MTDELIGKLAEAQIPGLRVLPPTATMAYRSQEVSAQTVVEELGVDAVIEGSVFESNVTLLVRVTLTDGRQILLTREYERDQVGIPLIVNTSSGIMNTDSGHREHSPERSDGLASQFIPSESRFSLF